MSTPISLTEIQNCELYILKKAVEVFEANNIQYFLAYGTLLGAVRHNGFIPWDDDIDIFVPRDDYEKLKEVLRRDGLGEEYLSFGIPGDSEYPYPFIKVIDKRYRIDDAQIKDIFNLFLWIDVFPLDHLPDDANLDKKVIIRTGKYMHLLVTEITNQKNTFNAKYVLKKCLSRFMGGYRGLARYIDRRAKRINIKNAQSKVYGNVVWPQYRKDFFSQDMVSPLCPQAFCDTEFMIPRNYDSHLQYIYGAYMQLPPEEKRQRHYIKAYKEV